MADVIETTASAITAGVTLVKMIKEKFGYTAEDLAVACGLTVEELNCIETGADAEPGKLHRIAHSVGLPDVTAQIQH
ncbi:helix-turn-helix domain-containing protein [Phyllobacterium sp. SB3]|uniref:helix-turn-helix domain-containing protein n=1 Tax=Phyllobacterium sp. SB3 TaxID=3156073 RepID=UPI0032AEE945